MTKCLIFDLDGTLIKLPIRYEILQKNLQNFFHTENNMHITEIDSGKFHTTTPLWGYISSKFFNQDSKYNLPYLYTKIGLGEISDPEILGNDIYPVETLLVRHIDCGDWIIKDDGTKVQVL